MQWMVVIAVLIFLGWGLIVINAPEHLEKLVLDLTPLVWGLTALLFILATVIYDA